jgi:catechol 2,3-dioxygenase-like lactoylglutathione lyase family enzyme
MIRPTLALALALLATAAPAIAPTSRPAITGISHLAVYTRDARASEHFYVDLLGATKAADPENAAGTRYYLGGQQFVEVLPAPAGLGASVLAHAGFTTADAAGLRRYFAAHATRDLSPLHRDPDGAQWFAAADPEGNRVEFVQPGRTQPAAPHAISARIIHVGYAVHDRAREDGFFRALIGFRPYWFGAMKPDHVDWVSQQVPDGRDWLEYMMVGGNSTVDAAKVDAHELGVLNHLSLGVPDMHKAVARLTAEHRLPPRHDGPQMGLDGKWQANLYDPDGTRIELMEFEPVGKPCCSAFTAASPSG